MDLKEFGTFIADGNSYNIKVVLGNLIGMGPSKDTWGTALANLYKSFPEEITNNKQTKKELAPLMVRYFSIYSLSKDNISIFEDYSDVFSAKDKDRIKDRNPNWNWEKEPEIIFKNTLDFVKSIPQETKGDLLFKYIKKYEEQFSVFVKTKNDKVLEHFRKKDIWKCMVRSDYSRFSDFCEKYNFNKLEILSDLLKNNSSSLAYLGGFKDKQVDLFLKDFESLGKESVLSNTEFRFFAPKVSIPNQNHNNVFSCLLSIINNKEFDAAVKYMNFFDQELNDVAKIVSFSKDFKSAENFKSILESWVSQTNISQKYEAKKVLEDESWFKFYSSYTLMNNLTEKLEDSPKTKVNKIKI